MKQSVVLKWYKAEHWFFIHKMKSMANIVYHLMQIIFGCSIPPQVVLEEGVDIPHFHAIVIHQKTIIGAGTKIYQNVTIGARNGEGGAVIGKNCFISCGAVILGKVTIGDNVNIGANAVVLDDIPSNCTVVGIPAKIVKKSYKDQEGII